MPPARFVSRKRSELAKWANAFFARAAAERTAKRKRVIAGAIPACASPAWAGISGKNPV